MRDSAESGNNDLQRIKVAAETIKGDVRGIRFSISHPQKADQEIAYFQMKDFGKFVYFAGMHTDEDFRGKGIASMFLKKALGYLEENDKFAFVSNQISRVNNARNMYSQPDWLPLMQHNWMIYIPKKLRNLESPFTVPLKQDELDEMVRTCMQN